jgi:four helix bundle protein
MRNYRDLQVWGKAHNLTLELYRVSQRFPREEIYGITGQLRRAAVSIGQIWQKAADAEQVMNWPGL